MMLTSTKQGTVMHATYLKFHLFWFIGGCGSPCCWAAAGIPGTDLLRLGFAWSRLDTGLVGTSG